MNTAVYNTRNYLRHSFVLLVLLSILIQPVITSIVYIVNTDIKLAQLDLEENTDDEENQKHIENTSLIVYPSYTDYTANQSNYLNEKFIRDFSLKIVVPPPEYT